MNKLEDALKELPEKMQLVFWSQFETEFSDYEYPFYHKELMAHFFIEGYKAAIAERAKFDEQNGLIVKDLCNTHEVIQ